MKVSKGLACILWMGTDVLTFFCIFEDLLCLLFCLRTVCTVSSAALVVVFLT